ncbi:uncharacterized protein NECHADRAFT_62846 [Fusarium vanettenii 77-13-4]|uniref:Deacetylase sirtuin-type domain-containing protein n=1 Tax=Fusarium vanettenii (strain ATCC MYA-4622 / CBS 123669 / FGSC 9596 / NRRL 45880 / 77-13-4) TaxID=660122 RepID=C7YYT9_FUSV7|nr:uncharacterized protein NECHADRAFT_62846 [Fusarium vanettenii 77-13-4]EEU43056.1 predicted protein [Fusarium vanettenii 77-13-4]
MVPMRKFRIPYTVLPPPSTVTPASASTLPGAVEALRRFFAAPSPAHLPSSAVVLTGAGLSVASGLADYRGDKGTYRVNKTYRPIYYYEFLNNHESIVCTTCSTEYSRDEFQQDLARLNPRWAALLNDALASGALDTEDPDERRFKGIKMNPDGDVDLPDAPYTTFRYPSCPKCLSSPPINADGHRHVVDVDSDGAWVPPSTAGVLKPAVVMFGESIDSGVKHAAEEAIDSAGKLLIVGTSLATYSAWRLAKRAQDRCMPIAVISMGGIRGEDKLFVDIDPNQQGEQGVRVALSTDDLLPALLSALRNDVLPSSRRSASLEASIGNPGVFKDMLS